MLWASDSCIVMRERALIQKLRCRNPKHRTELWCLNVHCYDVHACPFHAMLHMCRPTFKKAGFRRHLPNSRSKVLLANSTLILSWWLSSLCFSFPALDAKSGKLPGLVVPVIGLEWIYDRFWPMNETWGEIWRLLGKVWFLKNKKKDSPSPSLGRCYSCL